MNFNAEKMHRMCLRKNKYKTLRQAKLAVEKYKEKYDTEYRIYYCTLCGNYHLTTKGEIKK